MEEMDEWAGMEPEEIEKAVVTALLLRQDALPEVSGWLRPEMFQAPQLGFVYEAICRQFNRGEQSDYLTTENEMRRMDEERFREYGGLDILTGSLGVVRHPGNVTTYAQEVKRRYMLRSLTALYRKELPETQLFGSDPLELIARMEQSLLTLRENMVTGEMRPAGELMKEVVDFHRRVKEGEEEEFCVFSNLAEFDSIFGGFHNGELYILGGRPGDGKTAMAMHIALEVAAEKKNVLFFSLEMSNRQKMHRILARETGVDSRDLRDAAVSDADLQKMEELAEQWKDKSLYIDYTPNNTVESIRSQVLLMKKKGLCDLAIVDYVQLVKMNPLLRQDTQDLMIGRQVNALKQLAKEADCPIIALSQMNRNSENRGDKQLRPALVDLRDSGMIEQSADGVFFIRRPARHGITEDPATGEKYKKNTVLLFVIKNRNGTTGMARCLHNKDYNRFVDYDDEEATFA